jgi:hypothetical protein
MPQQYALHVPPHGDCAVSVKRARTDVDRAFAEINVGVAERQSFRDSQAGSIKKKKNGRKRGGVDRASPSHLALGCSGQQPRNLGLRINIGEEPSPNIRLLFWLGDAADLSPRKPIGQKSADEGSITAPDMVSQISAGQKEIYVFFRDQPNVDLADEGRKSPQD